MNTKTGILLNTINKKTAVVLVIALLFAVVCILFASMPVRIAGLYVGFAVLFWALSRMRNKEFRKIKRE
jgi:hypothetical protein